MANRCNKYLAKLIHENQVGFIKGRNITDNIRSVSDILQYLKDNDLPGILLNIDFEKAFDSVDWKFMLFALEKFNFGPSFVKWVKTIYNNISSCVKNNSHTSTYFEVKRGVRQGDPLSPYLFILIVETMANKIRQEKLIEGIQIKQYETKVLQYADDTSELLKNLKSAKHFLKIVQEFGQYSGLTLNVDKTESMWLGNNRFNKTKPLGILWPDRPIRILGVYFSYDIDACDKLNFLNRVDKSERILNWWTCRNLTLYGRIQIIKTFIMSQFMYVSSVVYTLPEVVKLVNKLAFQFIWRKKRERIKRTVLISNIDHGGLNAPHFQTMVNTARLKWVNKLTDNTEALWKVILEKYLDKVNVNLYVLLYSNFNMKSTGLDKAILPEFYKEMLKLWSDVGNTLQMDKSNLIWYNREIRVNERSLFYKELFTAGAWYITDLYRLDGTAVDFETLVSRGVGRCNLIKWMGLIEKTKRLIVLNNGPSGEINQLVLATNVPFDQTNNKTIYNKLLLKTTQYIAEVYVPRISKYLENSQTIEWNEVYLRANQTTIDTKTKEFQYIFIHDLLSNHYWLHKWGVKDTDICQYCKTESENIVHMFWTCPTSTLFWEEFSQFCDTHLHELYRNILSMQDIFLGVDDKTVCTLIFLAKTFIYNKIIHDEPFTFDTFKKVLSKFKNIEFHIAKSNNRLDDWVEKWKFLPATN